MNPEIKAKWLDALRSGDYTQGQRYLAVKNKQTGEFDFCCLGVLCDLAVAEGAIDPPTVIDYWSGLEGGENLVHAYKVDESSNPSGSPTESRVLPPKVQAWAGLDSDSPGYTKDFATCGDPDCDCGGPSAVALAGENDNGVPFSEIADLIEEHL